MAKETAQSAGFEQALRDLAEAISELKVEPICTSYLALRQEAREMTAGELLGRVEQAAGERAKEVIVSAFSRRRCFMCKDGTVPCQTCDGTGTVDRFPCPQCEGLSVEPCSFCLGSSWTDRDEIPVEVRRAVLKRRGAHVEKDITRLVGLARGAWASAERLAPEKRTEIGAWLMRLQSRLNDLAKAVSDNGDEKAARFGAMAAEIDKLLASIQVRRTPPGEPQGD